MKIEETHKNKAHKLLHEFDGEISYVISHCLETLELLYKIGANMTEIYFYQNVLYYVSKIYEPESEQNRYKICPICRGYGNHTDECFISIYQKK